MVFVKVFGVSLPYVMIVDVPTLIYGNIRAIGLVSIFDTYVKGVVEVRVGLVIVDTMVATVFFKTMFIGTRSIYDFTIRGRLTQHSTPVGHRFVFRHLVDVRSFLRKDVFGVFTFRGVSVHEREVLKLQGGLVCQDLFTNNTVLNECFFIFAKGRVGGARCFLPGSVFVGYFLCSTFFVGLSVLGGTYVSLRPILPVVSLGPVSPTRVYNGAPISGCSSDTSRDSNSGDPVLGVTGLWSQSIMVGTLDTSRDFLWSVGSLFACLLGFGGRAVGVVYFVGFGVRGVSFCAPTGSVLFPFFGDNVTRNFGVVSSYTSFFSNCVHVHPQGGFNGTKVFVFLYGRRRQGRTRGELPFGFGNDYHTYFRGYGGVLRGERWGGVCRYDRTRGGNTGGSRTIIHFKCNTCRSTYYHERRRLPSNMWFIYFGIFVTVGLVCSTHGGRRGDGCRKCYHHAIGLVIYDGTSTSSYRQGGRPGGRVGRVGFVLAPCLGAYGLVGTRFLVGGVFARQETAYNSRGGPFIYCLGSTMELFGRGSYSRLYGVVLLGQGFSIVYKGTVQGGFWSIFGYVQTFGLNSHFVCRVGTFTRSNLRLVSYVIRVLLRFILVGVSGGVFKVYLSNFFKLQVAMEVGSTLLT